LNAIAARVPADDGALLHVDVTGEGPDVVVLSAGRPKALRVNHTDKPHPLTMHPGTVLPPT
jgi:hypothetical protein